MRNDIKNRILMQARRFLMYTQPHSHFICNGFIALSILYFLTINPLNISWLISSLSLFPLQILLFVFLFSIGLFFVQKRLSNICAILSLCSAFLYIRPIWEDMVNVGPSHLPSTRQYTIITYNWEMDNPNVAGIAGWLRSMHPDVVSIEEFGQWMPGAKTEMLEILPYHSRIHNTDDVIVLSRYPIKSEKYSYVGNRVFVNLLVQFPEGEISVGAGHPESLHTNPEFEMRNAYFSDIETTFTPAAKGQVLLGDFNATDWDPAFREMKERLRLHEESRLLPLGSRIVTLGKIEISSPIDHVLASREVNVSTCALYSSLGSDHKPLVCGINFGAPQ